MRAEQKHREDSSSKHSPSSSISRWKQQEEHLLRLPQKTLRHKNYYITKKDDPRLTGCFPKQRAKLKLDIIRRRGAGIPCSTTWVGHRMFQICSKDMPEGFDPSNKNQFNKARIHRFMGHEDLSVRSRTNKKKKSIFERMHKIMKKKKTRLPLHRNRLHLQRKHHRNQASLISGIYCNTKLIKKKKII